MAKRFRKQRARVAQSKIRMLVQEGLDSRLPFLSLQTADRIHQATPRSHETRGPFQEPELSFHE
jgi:hypothetical protein